MRNDCRSLRRTMRRCWDTLDWKSGYRTVNCAPSGGTSVRNVAVDGTFPLAVRLAEAETEPTVKEKIRTIVQRSRRTYLVCGVDVRLDTEGRLGVDIGPSHVRDSANSRCF